MDTSLVVIFLLFMDILSFYLGRYESKQIYAKRSGKFKVRKKSIVVYAEVAVFDCVVKGNDGLIPASKGDYIITEADGNRYPLKPDDFKKNYEII